MTKINTSQSCEDVCEVWGGSRGGRRVDTLKEAGQRERRARFGPNPVVWSGLNSEVH